jgi:hypothetical protein
MSKEGLNGFEVNSFEKYQSAGGIINKKDYESALAQAKKIKGVDASRLAQVRIMAGASGIVLEDTGTEIDPRVALYSVLRADINTDTKVGHQHNYLSDQRLFREVLLMLGDTESLGKLISAHPHIFPEGK